MGTCFRDFEFRNTQYDATKCEDIEVEKILQEFPELANGSVGPHGITALQIVAAFTRSGITNDMKKFLISGDVNKSDHLGRHPLHYAVINGNYEMAKVLLENCANPNCIFLPRKSTLRDNQEIYIRWNKLFNKLPSPDEWRRTPLHLAVKDDWVNIVRLLVENGADVNAEDAKGLTPLLLAGYNKKQEPFENIVEILVKAKAHIDVKNKATGTTALFHAAVALKSIKATKVLLEAGAWLTTVGPSQETELHVVSSIGLEEILGLFLVDSRLTLNEINRPDCCGRTPLYRAAFSAQKNCLKMLVEKGGSLAIVTNNMETVMDAIFARIQKPSGFLRDLLDGKVTGNALRPTELILDFSILAPEGCRTQMDVISNMMLAASDKEKFEILLHPLIESFLRLKWEKIRQFFFLLIFLYITFALSLSTYVILLIRQEPHLDTLTTISRCLTIGTSGALTGHAIIQLVLVRRKFFTQYEVWMNLISTTLSLILAIAGSEHISVDNEDKIETPKWILHAASVAVLFAWTEMMMLIGRFPAYGYYALMFAAVLQNVIKVLFTFVCLVIGFAISFSIQFHSYEQFSNPWQAVVKTTVMMMGEFEYADLFAGSDENKMRLPATSRLIFLFFIILASIVLMNLMVGLAVSDIQGLQEESHARRLEKQSEFLRQFEKVMAFRMVVDSKWFPNWLRNFLKRKRCIKLQLVIPVEHFALVANRKIKKLPIQLIESLVNIATKQEDHQSDRKKRENPIFFAWFMFKENSPKKIYRKKNLRSNDNRNNNTAHIYIITNNKEL